MPILHYTCVQIYSTQLVGTGDTVHAVSHGAGTQQDTVVEQAGRKYTRGKLQRRPAACIAGTVDRTRGTRWMQH